MNDVGSSVTLIFYKIGNDWYKGGEPLLNLIAAAAQGSVFTHIEIAIGETPGDGGRMSNVLRVFNDAIGVVKFASLNRTVHANCKKLAHLMHFFVSFSEQEVAERTGINPSYSYLQLGCSKRQEQAMLHFAKSQVGKPFSQSGMARSLFWPRKSDGKSWYCAELVAACLQVGGLMSPNSSTGSATPSSLYKLYKNCGAVAANPCTLRRQFGNMTDHSTAMNLNLLGLKGAANHRAGYSQIPTSSRPNVSNGETFHRSSSPPKLAFRQLASVSNKQKNTDSFGSHVHTVSLTLASLDMSRR